MEEIGKAKSGFKLTKSYLVQSEVKEMVEEHFNIKFNGDAVDLFIHEIGKGDLNLMKTNLGLDENRMHNIKSRLDFEADIWIKTLSEYLDDGKSLNLANDEIVEMLAGLAVHRVNGNSFTLPKLSKRKKTGS